MTEAIPHLFHWEKPANDEHTETIKWSLGNSRYEIHCIVLHDLDLAVLLPHCLEIKNKIEAVVTANNHLGPSFFRVFPRTISTVLRTIWDLIIPGIAETADGFADAIQQFIASHGTPED